MSGPSLAARAMLAGAIASAVWIAALAIFGAVDLSIGPLAIRSHRVLPAALLLACCGTGLAALAATRRTVVRDEVDALRRLSGALALAAAALTFLVAVKWGTNAAGGSDSYCYLSQARLFASGAVRIEQPWLESLRIPDLDRAAVPAGYTAAPGPRGTIAPMCPAGLALLMAAFFRVAGERAMLLVVPLLGACAVWLTYRIGLRVASRGAAAAAATITAASPIVLYQVVQPMSDVPAACLWLAALLLACGASSDRRAALTGLAAAAALIVRPNLLPMAAVVGAWLMNEAGIGAGGHARAWRVVRAGAAYGSGLLPGLVFIAAIQTVMYGSPLRSGYDSLDMLFRREHALPNLQRYPAWLLATHTPAMAFAALAPFLRGEPGRSRRRWLLMLLAAANLACYVFYTPFDDWWYLRFLLPAIPCLILLATATVDDLLRLLPRPIQTSAGFLAVFAVAVWYVHVAEARSVFRLRTAEARYGHTGRYLARSLPADAVVFAAFQSGSVRYYAARRTLAWDALAPDSLDGAIAELTAKNLSPVLVLERWEEPLFRARFGGRARAGQLDWPPRAQIGRDVRVYDPADRGRYLAGASIPTERIWIEED